MRSDIQKGVGSGSPARNRSRRLASRLQGLNEPDPFVRQWEMLRVLDERLQRAAKAERSDRLSLYPDILPEREDDLLLRYVRDDLHVLGGTFGVANEETKEFILLQSREYSKPDPIPLICIPFAIDDTKQARLLEYMFLVRRRAQRLDSDPPEFYDWLSLTNPQEREQHLGWFLSATERRLLRTAPFKFGLCAANEMLFFLYAWRWLVRFAQSCGPDAPLDPSWAWDLPADAPLDLWNLQRWSGEEEGPEATWCRALEDLYKDLRPPWDWLHARFDGNGGGSLMQQEWRSLGLSRPQTFKNFARFLTTLLRPRLSPGSEGTTIAAALDQLSALAEQLGNEATISQDLMARADASLRTIVSSFFSAWHRDRGQRKPTSSREYLTILHRASRIPLLPYYYVVALRDGNACDHLILSVHESRAYPSKIGQKEKLESATVICILMLSPEWRRNSRNRDGSTTDPVHYLTCLRTFFTSLAHPIVDEGFYGSLFRMAERSDVRRRFAHRHLGMIENLEFLLRRDPTVWNNLPLDARASLFHLKAGVSRFRQSRHDSRRIYDPGDAEPFALYSRIAGLQALDRAIRGTKKPVVPDFNERMYEVAYSFLKQANREADTFLEYLDWTVPSIHNRLVHPRSTQIMTALARQENFAVMFVQVLWQALYHSFVFKLQFPNEYDRNSKPLVVLASADREFSDRVVIRVINRGQRVREGIPSKDVAELQEMADHFTQLSTEGPKYSGHERWETVFQISVNELRADSEESLGQEG